MLQINYLYSCTIMPAPIWAEGPVTQMTIGFRCYWLHRKKL